jgi:hypothetical protein
VENCGSGIRKVIQLNPEQSEALQKNQFYVLKEFQLQGFVDS